MSYIIEKDLTPKPPASWQEAQQAEELDFEEEDINQDENIQNPDGEHACNAPAKPRATQWARKEPVKSKKRLLYQDDEDEDDEDLDIPDILDYLADFDLSALDKIAMLRSAANYLSAQQRRSKEPVKK